MYGCLHTSFAEGSGHHVAHFFLIILFIYLFLLSFCVDCLFGFSTYPPLPLFFLKPRKGNNIIYNHFKCCALRLPPQTWYFFNWSMLVGSVKGFASKSINLTAEGKSGFVSHTKLTAEATFMNLFHSWLITCTMWFWEFENKITYLGAVKFKTKD